jgi:hypothetical protein
MDCRNQGLPEFLIDHVAIPFRGSNRPKAQTEGQMVLGQCCHLVDSDDREEDLLGVPVRILKCQGLRNS